jgi:hypothetical protein
MGWIYVRWILTARGFVWWTPKACASHHPQIYGPVHGATTHENSTTMSLRVYGLA